MIGRTLLRTALMLCALSPSLACAAPTSSTIGFDEVHTTDGMEIGIWYPADGQPEHQRLGIYEQDAVAHATPVGNKLPLVVMSHGTGGSYAEHLDTAGALAKAGFVVAALTHPGDNWQDQSHATQMEARPAALVALVSYMLDRWPSRSVINPGRVGAFGFSAGGFTVLAAAGGRPDLSRVAAHCADHPTFFDCGLMLSHPPSQTAWPAVKDDRIKALVVAAPALGFTFDRIGLSGVTIPVQLWRADADQILPAPFYADAVRAALPKAPEFHNVPGAGHFDFLAPCAAGAPPLPICASAPGFDRAAFHQRFNSAVVSFFSQRLH